MDSLKSVLETISKSINKTNINFVYYDNNTGEIKRITNNYEETDDLVCIEVPHDTVKDIITGLHRIEDYVVSYDKETKSVSVKHKDVIKDKVNYFFQVQKQTINKNDYERHVKNKDNVYDGQIPIYQDIFVDVWYNELEHYAGQHVWYNNSVYKIKQYQEANTDFKRSNADVLLEYVKLFNDKNNDLFFDKNIEGGDKFLSFNKLYLYKQSLLDTDVDMLIIQHLQDSKWKIFLSEKVFKTLKELYRSENSYEMKLSITANNDPNILYRSLELNVNDLIVSKIVEIPFEYDWEKNGKSVSIFVDKYFDSYFYGVVQ